jgi:hypothetical protein
LQEEIKEVEMEQEQSEYDHNMNSKSSAMSKQKVVGKYTHFNDLQSYGNENPAEIDIDIDEYK